MGIKVIIADDDDGIRLVLRKIINKVDGFELIGEAADGEIALRLAESLRPDVIFMDVEMPLLDGVECAKKVFDINPVTKIIFATAHEEYMPDAFQVYAFDYVIKPFKVDRIVQTLERIKTLHSHEEVYQPPISLNQVKSLDKLVIRSKESVCFVNMDNIILIQREDRSTVVYTKAERYVTSDSLSELEEKLDSSIFLRSHKSYIINLSMVHTIYPYGRWTYVVKLIGTDKDALLTHEKYEELQKRFGL